MIENKKTNKIKVLAIALFLALTLFVGFASAAENVTVSDCDTLNVNTYGSTRYDISADTSTIINSEAVNPVHNSDEYLGIVSITHSPASPVVNNDVLFNFNGMRGTTAYVNSNNLTVYNTYTADYGTDGVMSGNVFKAKYSSVGTKNPIFTVTTFNGDVNLNAQPVTVVASATNTVTITTCAVNNVNIYGKTEQYDISDRASPTSTTSAITHTANEYVNFGNLVVTPVEGDSEQVFVFSTGTVKGAVIHEVNHLAVQGYEIDYDIYSEDGTMVGNDLFKAKYDIYGSKVAKLTANSGAQSTSKQVNVYVGLITGLTMNGAPQSSIPVLEYFDSVDVAVQTWNGGTGLTYHWYATPTPEDVTSWSDKYFDTPTESSAKYTADEVAGNYAIKVVVSDETYTQDSRLTGFELKLNVHMPEYEHSFKDADKLAQSAFIIAGLILLCLIGVLIFNLISGNVDTKMVVTSLVLIGAVFIVLVIMIALIGSVSGIFVDIL